MYRRNIHQELRAPPLSWCTEPAKREKARSRRGEFPGAEFFTLDDASPFGAASADPQGFISSFSGPVVLEEVQRLPELFTAIKWAVDRDRRPGRFLLTGSANVLVLPRTVESLAGRMEVLTLRPLGLAAHLLGVNADRFQSDGALLGPFLENFVAAEAVGKRFLRGVVLYLGQTAVSFGKNLMALPVEALWKM